MAKRNDLHRKLKAADRRRRKRPTGGSGLAPATTATPPVDAPGLIVEAILHFRDGSQRFDDAIIIAALKACRRGIRPGGEQAAELFDQLQQIAAREKIPPRVLVRACDELLAQADQADQPSSQLNPFASYLSILVS